MPATWMPHLGGVSLLKRVDRIRLFRGRPKEGLDAFDRDWGCGRGRALARGRGADAVGAGERRGDRAGGGRHRPPDAGPLLVRLARSARQLPALALLVTPRSASTKEREGRTAGSKTRRMCLDGYGSRRSLRHFAQHWHCAIACVIILRPASS